MALNFPSNPSLNQIYTVGDQSWKWNGTSWIIVSQSGTLGPVYIGSLPPSVSVEGDLWWNSDIGQLFVRYVDADGAQWVSANTAPVTADLDSDAVIDAILEELTQYSDQAAAVAGGVPAGGLYKVTGTGVAAIRVVI